MWSCGITVRRGILRCEDCFMTTLSASSTKTIPKSATVLTTEHYKALPHILVRFGMHLDTLVEQAWKLAKLDMNIAATAPSFSSMLFMLPGTRMIATVQRRFAQALAASLRLRVLECPVKVKTLQQVLMWHPRSDLDPGHRYLRQMFIEGCQGREPMSRIPLPGLNAAQAAHPRERRFEPALLV